MRLANARVKNYSSQKKTMSTSSREFKTLARMPLTKLKSTATSPKNYILVPLKINDEGPFNFILDTGSTVTLIRPSIVTDILKLTPKAARVSMALMGGGISNQNNMTINLKDVKIGDHALCNVSVSAIPPTPGTRIPILNVHSLSTVFYSSIRSRWESHCFRLSNFVCAGSTDGRTNVTRLGGICRWLAGTKYSLSVRCGVWLFQWCLSLLSTRCC